MKNFVPAGSRRGGNGTVVDRLVFAGFELEWERVEYTLYAARVREEVTMFYFAADCSFTVE